MAGAVIEDSRHDGGDNANAENGQTRSGTNTEGRSDAGVTTVCGTLGSPPTAARAGFPNSLAVVLPWSVRGRCNVCSNTTTASLANAELFRVIDGFQQTYGS